MNEKSEPVSLNVNENNMALLAHLSGLFLAVWGPLIMYFVFKDSGSDKLKQNISHALNWNLSLLIYSTVSFFLIFLIVGFVLLPILGLLHVIFSILGAIEANKGNVYKYPLTIEFIK